MTQMNVPLHSIMQTQGLGVAIDVLNHVYPEGNWNQIFQKYVDLLKDHDKEERFWMLCAQIRSLVRSLKVPNARKFTNQFFNALTIEVLEEVSRRHPSPEWTTLLDKFRGLEISRQEIWRECGKEIYEEFASMQHT
jgi:hypothetical protein